MSPCAEAEAEDPPTTCCAENPQMESSLRLSRRACITLAGDLRAGGAAPAPAEVDGLALEANEVGALRRGGEDKCALLLLLLLPLLLEFVAWGTEGAGAKAAAADTLPMLPSSTPLKLSALAP